MQLTQIKRNRRVVRPLGERIRAARGIDIAVRQGDAHAVCAGHQLIKRKFAASGRLRLRKLFAVAAEQHDRRAAQPFRIPAHQAVVIAVQPDAAGNFALREQTERMTQMTKTLLEMSELRTVSCADRIEIAPMVEEIFTDLAPLAEKNNITLESTGDAVMTGSDTLIYRLLYNLTENAIRYNRFDGTVNITVTHKDNQLVITVADTGYGIPEQYRESIFQPFFRVDKSRSREYGGVGLGLSLVWEIVALHNGKVRVEESSEKGTVIVVKFPTDVIKI